MGKILTFFEICCFISRVVLKYMVIINLRNSGDPERKIQMKRFWKIFLTIAAILLMLSLASCGNSASNPDDADGTWGGISWSYTKADHKLTISGGGDIPGCADPADIPWYGVRSAVKEVEFDADDDDSFSTIGDNVFFGMTSLESVDIPEGVISVGECAFAFCSSLKEAELPSTLVTIESGAFEACSALEELEIPAATTEIGESAFAFCRELAAVTVNGSPEQIKKWAFRDCVALESFRMDSGETVFDADAFEGAALKESDIKSLRTSVVSIACKDADGESLGGDANAVVLEVGEKKEISAPSIDGYELVSDATQTVEGTGEPISVEFIYSKITAEEDSDAGEVTEAPATPDGEDKKDGVDPMTVIAIVIFAVVIIAIAVGAFLLIRAEKNTTKDSRTVRKNGKDNNKKGKKK